MTITETCAKTLLRIQKRTDSWFVSSMGMNIYRGCTHNCTYCDGQAERYGLSGTFGKDVEIKTNAAALLKKELTAKRRKPLPGGFVCVGGGVTDTFQPINNRYGLAKEILTILRDNSRPVHLLTKSHHILNDLDLIEQIHQQNGATISVSFSTVDDAIANILEPGAPPPSKRLDTLAQIKAAGIPCGMFLMPVIPGVSDHETGLSQSVDAAKSLGLDYVVFSTLTLKPGRQYDRFLNLVADQWPEHLPGYRKIFTGNRWGSPIGGYQTKIHNRFAAIATEKQVPVRIPDTIWERTVTPTEKVVIILEHLDYFAQIVGEKSPFGPAARTLSYGKIQLHDELPNTDKLKNIHPKARDVIHEILETGTSRLYREQLHSAD